MSNSIRQKLFRLIPKVDEMLAHPKVAVLFNSQPRPLIMTAVRSVLAAKRAAIQAAEESALEDFKPALGLERIALESAAEAERIASPRLKRVINASGVILHTNLGRAPLADFAVNRLVEIASGYSNLEFNLNSGERGERYEHVEELLQTLSGAEAALVVNNNAAAVLLMLNSLAAGQEVIISRGELVEIGGSFRIPEVMKASGAILREVGATNRTHLKDYEDAIGDHTRAILKVHPSNYRIQGFTAEVPTRELSELAHRYGLTLLLDLGSGNLIDFSRFNLPSEPTVSEATASGADLVSFSGDKILGGPQAGILVGKKVYVDRLKKNHLLRALRVDKFTLAALEATLLTYWDEARALKEIPALRMTVISYQELKARARVLLRRLNGIKNKADLRVIPSTARMGGGALPAEDLPSWAIAIKPHSLSVNALEKRLRSGSPPVVARIENEELILEVRTLVARRDLDDLAEAVVKAFAKKSGED